MSETQRSSMVQPADWWAAVDEAAKAESMSRAEWIYEAVKSRLPKKVAAKLSDRPPAHRPKKTTEGE